MDGYNQSGNIDVLTLDDVLLQIFEDTESPKMKRFRKSGNRGEVKGRETETIVTSCDSSEASEESSHYRNRSEHSDSGTTNPTSFAPSTKARSSPLPIPFSNPMASEIAADNEERMKYDRSTWRMFHRINDARRMAQTRPEPSGIGDDSIRSKFHKTLPRFPQLPNTTSSRKQSVDSITGKVSRSSSTVSIKGVFPLDL